MKSGRLLILQGIPSYEKKSTTNCNQEPIQKKAYYRKV